MSNGGNLLLISNHTVFTTNDSALANAFGITIVPAGFEMPQTPNTPLIPMVLVNTQALDWPLNNVEAYLACGVAPGNGTVLYNFPPGTIDTSGNNYNPSSYAFAVEYSFGSGSVIVAARSGVCGDAGTGWPAPGEVGNGSNLSFVLNCINYLGGAIG